MITASIETEQFKTKAHATGDHLCKTAFWNPLGNECNWMGHRDIEDALVAPYSERNAALSPELYGGSAGIALFLGELFGVTQRERFKKAGTAALRRSIRYIKSYPSPAYPLSVYAGHLGLLYVCLRFEELGMGAWSDEDRNWLFEHARHHWENPHPYDVIGGNAGAIPALLRIGERFREEECLALARKLGDELCGAAQWERDRCSWQATGGFAKLPPMTGYSHGASGISLSLLMLYKASGCEKYLLTARGGFAFEDAHYNPDEKNWVDTRYDFCFEKGRVMGRFRERWCHGAPGIAPARAFASLLDHEEGARHRELALAACDTAKIALNRCLDSPGFDTTLCHGIAGLSECLLKTSELLNEPSLRGFASEAMAQVMPRYHAPSDWPSGLISKGVSPCLMVGSSGVAHHLLRLVSKDVPSPLLIAPSCMKGL